MKRFFRFATRVSAAVAAVAFVLTLGVSATAEFDVAPDSVEFERISVQSEQMLIQAGFMDKTDYGWCGGWGCWTQAQCGQCFCKKPNYWKPGECVG